MLLITHECIKLYALHIDNDTTDDNYLNLKNYFWFNYQYIDYQNIHR